MVVFSSSPTTVADCATAPAPVLPALFIWDFENVRVDDDNLQALVKRMRDIAFANTAMHSEKAFLICCDVRNLSPHTTRVMNKIRNVDIVHVDSMEKNAADEKIKQKLHQFDIDFRESAGSSAYNRGTIVLISGDGGFSYFLSNMRRSGWRVVVFHGPSMGRELTDCADVHHDLNRLLQEVRGKDYKEKVNGQLHTMFHSSHILVSDLPSDVSLDKVVARLQQLNEKFGGKVRYINSYSREAILEFQSKSQAKNAYERVLQGRASRDIFGFELTVAAVRDPVSSLTRIRIVAEDEEDFEESVESVPSQHKTPKSGRGSSSGYAESVQQLLVQAECPGALLNVDSGDDILMNHRVPPVPVTSAKRKAVKNPETANSLSSDSSNIVSVDVYGTDNAAVGSSEQRSSTSSNPAFDSGLASGTSQNNSTNNASSQFSSSNESWRPNNNCSIRQSMNSVKTTQLSIAGRLLQRSVLNVAGGGGLQNYEQAKSAVKAAHATTAYYETNKCQIQKERHAHQNTTAHCVEFGMSSFKNPGSRRVSSNNCSAIYSVDHRAQNKAAGVAEVRRLLMLAQHSKQNAAAFDSSSDCGSTPSSDQKVNAAMPKRKLTKTVTRRGRSSGRGSRRRRSLARGKHLNSGYTGDTVFSASHGTNEDKWVGQDFVSGNTLHSERYNFKPLRSSTTYGYYGSATDGVYERSPRSAFASRNHQVQCYLWNNVSHLQGNAIVDCPYYHPKESCKNYPRCQFGAEVCIFAHPFCGRVCVCLPRYRDPQKNHRIVNA